MHVARSAEGVADWLGEMGLSRDLVCWKDAVYLLFEKCTDCVQITDGGPGVAPLHRVLLTIQLSSSDMPQLSLT
jgi:hypothetical protein